MNSLVASGDGPTQYCRQYLIQSSLTNSMPSAVPLWMTVGLTRSHRLHNPRNQFSAIVSPSVASGDGSTQSCRQYITWTSSANSMLSVVPLWMAAGPTRSYRQHDFRAILGDDLPTHVTQACFMSRLKSMCAFLP